MLVGVATRQYARSLEPGPADVVSRGTSKSSVSRRFVAKTTAQLRAWQSAPLDGLELVALILDGVHIGEDYLVVALGIAADGPKHALGLWEGATGEHGGVSEPARESPEPGAAHGPQPPAPVGPGDRTARLSGERRKDGNAAPYGSRQTPGGRLSQRRRQRPGRAGRNG